MKEEGKKRKEKEKTLKKRKKKRKEKRERKKDRDGIDEDVRHDGGAAAHAASPCAEATGKVLVPHLVEPVVMRYARSVPAGSFIAAWLQYNSTRDEYSTGTVP